MGAKSSSRNKKQQPSSSSSSSDHDAGQSDESETRDEEPVVVSKKTTKSKVEKKDEISSSSDHDSDSDSDKDEPKTGFTDENAKWLKPKQRQSAAKNKKSELLSSSDEDASDAGDEDDDLLEVERQAQALDEEMEAEQAEAQAEFQRQVATGTQVYHLPTPEEWETDRTDRLVPPSELRQHVESILEVLVEFQQRREPGRARQEYITMLSQCLAEFYGYLPELVDYFLTMFSPVECVEFIKASDQARPLVIRTNTIKTRRKDLAAALMKRGVSLDPLASWSKVGLKILESPVPLGATPEYLGGYYMLQSAASMCPVLALNPQPHDRVLDMSAAPGGKTSYIAQLLRNTGSILANDLKAERQKATVANLHRLGVRNCTTMVFDGRQLGKRFHNRFHRILLDAPCSGLGVISRDPSVKVQRTLADIQTTARLQKELILSAIDALQVHKDHPDKDGKGTMVYSTCSVSVFENEDVVQYALSKRDIKIVDSGLEFGKPGFVRYQQKRYHPSIALTRRFYPHVHNMDGFFVAKIIKLSDRKPEDTLDPTEVGEEGAEANAGEDNNEKKATVTTISKKKKKLLPPHKRKQLREKEGANDEDNAKAGSKKRSVPPAATQPKKKRKRTSANVTKPRRNRVATDA